MSPATLREAVVEQLRLAIITGQLPPGEILKDGELAARLGLSTTPIREALVQLAAEGLVEIKPNRLKRVAAIDLEAMIELLEVQSHLWCLGYRLGAPKIDAEDIAELKRIYLGHAEAIAYGDLTAAISAANAFHRVFMAASGNRELVRVSLDRVPLIQRFVRLCAPELVSVEMLKKHRDILAALEQGELEAAIDLNREACDALTEAARRLRGDEAAAQPATIAGS